MEAEELTLDTAAGLSLAARAWGPAAGRPVLCLHGWLDNAASFDALAPLLLGATGEALRLVCLDLPGHGRSEHRHATASYDFLYWIPDALDAAEALGWERFALLGHSLGASIALCLAGTVPKRVERAVLIDGLGPLVTPADEGPERLAAAIAARRRLRARRPSIYGDLDLAVEHKQRALRGLSTEAARLLTQRGVAAVEGGFVWRHDPRLQGHSMIRLTEAQVRAYLRRVTCPVLFVRPRDGWPVPDRAVSDRLDCLQRVELVQVEGGHHVHLVDPGHVAGVVGDFLRA